jgi:hypothetical protein
MAYGDSECNKHMPKIKICDIKPAYKFEKKKVCVYDFDEKERTEIERDELLVQKIRTVCRPQWFLRVQMCPKYEWIQKNVETTEKYWTKEKVEVPVKRYCPERIKKEVEVYEVACDWKKECKEIECKEIKESNCGCEPQEHKPKPQPQPCHSYQSGSSRSRSDDDFSAGRPQLPFKY